jgi:hypothetical protein
MHELTIRIERKAATTEHRLRVRELVIAGWTGRDQTAVETHIAELEAIGVSRPPRTPMFYRVSTTRLTSAPVIEVVGNNTSGEVEFVLTSFNGEMLVGVGSDHTDRKLETVGVTVAKQICDKPIGVSFWPLAEVEDHWDRLLLQSHAAINGARQRYQEGGVAGLLPPSELVARFATDGRFQEGVVLFGGTLPVHDGVRPAESFEGEIADPVLKRRISLAYDIHTLPDE